MYWGVVVIAIASEGPLLQLTVFVLFNLCSFPLVTESLFTCIYSCFSFANRLIHRKNVDSTRRNFDTSCRQSFKCWLHRTARTAEVNDGLLFDVLLINGCFLYLIFWCAKIDNHLFLFEGMCYIVIRIAIFNRTDNRFGSFNDRVWCL